MDFSRSDTRDVRWWRKVNILIGSLDTEQDREIIVATHRHHLALISNGSLKPEHFDAHKKHAVDCFNDLVRSFHPWTKPDDKQSVLTNIIDIYKREMGDPDDPEYMAKIEEGVRQFYEERKRSDVGESPEARMQRLLDERDARMRTWGRA